MAANVAFEILYKEYYARVFGLCRRLLGSPTLAEDATQETFMRVYKYFKRYDTSQPFWRWIANIANNHCIDLLRGRQRIADWIGSEAEELDSLPAEDIGALGQMISHEDSERINQAVEQLPDKYRVPLVLAYYNDASYDEIATSLSTSRNHVGVLLLRARQKLREELK